MALRPFPAAGILLPGLCGALVLLLSLGFSGSLLAEEKDAKTDSVADARADIPPVIAQIEALKLVKELFKDDYARLAKMKPEEKADLACKILETAQNTKDPAGKYAALKEALDMAAKSNSTGTVMDCIQEIQAAFKVPEAFEFKMTTLTAMANASGAAPESLTAVANALMDLARECWIVNQFDNAEKAATQAGAAAQKAKELNLVIQAKNFGDDAKLAAKEYEDAKPALELALSGADNEEANLKAGTFLCLIRGDWDKGIPCLLKTADGNPLKEMVKLEKEKGGSPEGMIELGKKWIECMEKAKLSGLQKRNAQIRARTWIEKGAAGLGGLDKATAEKLLAGLPEGNKFSDISKNPKDFTNSIGMKFKLIPEGEFLMGSTDTEAEKKTMARDCFEWGQKMNLKFSEADALSWLNKEYPQHRVTITKPFYLGICEVTQEQYEKIMGTNPSYFKGKNKPVEQVSWDDAQEFCKKLTEVDLKAGRLKAGEIYRLPTEAEWEYACRAGTKTRYYWGDKSNKEFFWYDANNNNLPHEVGGKKPNAWGLFDMSGNVWEWCEDRYEGYDGKAQTDPKGSSVGQERVLRGGSWNNPSMYSRSATRDNGEPERRNYLIGFRIVRTLQK